MGDDRSSASACSPQCPRNSLFSGSGEKRWRRTARGVSLSRQASTSAGSGGDGAASQQRTTVARMGSASVRRRFMATQTCQGVAENDDGRAEKEPGEHRSLRAM